MNFLWKKQALFAVITVMLGSMVSAQTQTPITIVTTAAPFLTISPDARTGGMGDMGIAVSPDASATFWNNAKTSFSDSRGQLGFTYTPWLADVASDVYLLSLSGYNKVNNNSAITYGVRYFNLGQINLADVNGMPLGNSNPREFSIEAGYAIKASNKFGVGVTARYINSNLGKGNISASDPSVIYKVGSAIAFDASAYYNGLDERGQGFTAGLTLSNLGTRISYTSDPNAKQYIPANIGIGGVYHFVLDDDNKLNIGLDLNHLMVPKVPSGLSTTGDTTIDNPINNPLMAAYYNNSVVSSWGSSFGNGAYSGSLGAEYSYIDEFFVRAGYHYETSSFGDRKYFTAGVGLKYSVLQFNFAYLAPTGSGINRNPLSNTLRFSLIWDMGTQRNY